MQGARHLRASALTFVALLGMASLSGCWMPAVSGARFFLNAPLVPVGGATGGGSVQFLMDARTHSAFFELDDLLANTDYTVMMDGVIFATLSTDPSGHTAENRPILSSAFDPRGHHLSIVDPDGVEVLTLPSPTDPRYVSAEVAPLSSFGPGGGVVRTDWVHGVQTTSIELAGVDPDVYDVFADGMTQGSIDAGSGAGALLESPPAFDPSTAVIQIRRQGVDYYAGGSHASIEGIDWCERGSVEEQFDAPTGTGLGWASLMTRSSCSRRLEMLIEDVPMGDYEVVVGGVYEGVMTVGQDQFGATSGTVLFTTNESTGQPLDFDPIGQPIEIEQDGVVYFSITAFSPN
jgi:hypothetical protein